MAIPVTLLCGYLGAGKTTVINHLLSAADGPRITVLVNDFGSINIDARLIANRGADTITLTNGCACCSIDDDLGMALQDQLDRAASLEHIVIEASGVAEPGRLAKSVEAWPGLELQAIATVVDASTIRTRIEDKFVGRLVRRQIEAASVLVLKKTDLAERGELAELKAWLHTVVPDAPHIEVTNGAVPFASLLRVPPPQESRQEARRSSLHEHAPHFHSTTVPLHVGLDLADLRGVLSNAPDGVHRIKGFVRDARDRIMLVQSTGAGHVTIEPYDTRSEAVPMALVCIATDRTSLDALSSALADLVHGTDPVSQAKAEPAS